MNSKKYRQKKSNVDVWLKRETPRKQKALENASRHFNNNDALTVNHLEAIYGQESSFGLNNAILILPYKKFIPETKSFFRN